MICRYCKDEMELEEQYIENDIEYQIYNCNCGTTANVSSNFDVVWENN